MATVLVLSGSPSTRTSRTALLAEHTAAGLRARGHRAHVLALRDLPAAPLLSADTHDAPLACAVSLVAETGSCAGHAPLTRRSPTDVPVGQPAPVHGRRPVARSAGGTEGSGVRPGRSGRPGRDRRRAGRRHGEPAGSAPGTRVDRPARPA
ncbi:NAD(P)H-dependent oxidoreductase [Streptomyces sp. Ac-502]|uniref:NAD(P)H-dependent oxidoreductase n=1 Tax=Streptomyces sp. Ac-502 TaxID=3342801 RepID=UPI0038623E99